MRHNFDQEYIDIKALCHFTEKQNEAWATVRTHKFVLYGGAMGGGKSYWLRWQLILLLFSYALQGFRHVVVGLFCEDYPSLEDRHISKIKFEFPSWLGKYNAADHTFTLKEAYGGGVIAFRNLDDVSKYQSSEFASIAVDELTKNKEINFPFLRTRLRWPGIDKTKFIAATNPGGIGHSWVKRYWIDKEFPPNEKSSQEFAYVRALVADNPYISDSYKQDLESFPDEHQRRAFLEGDWDVLQGQYFYEFRRELHTCPPHHPVPLNAKIFIAIDYGFTAPSAVLWCYRDSDDIVYVYRELYESNLTLEALAAAISANTPPSENISYWVADPSLWRKTGETGLSGEQILVNAYKRIRGQCPLLKPANNSRIIGWNMVRSHLKPIPGKTDEDNTSRLQIFTTCHNLIRTLPTLMHDPENPEDLDTRGEDHAADALRYALTSDPPKSPPPVVKLPTATNKLEWMLNNSGFNDTAQYIKPDFRDSYD